MLKPGRFLKPAGFFIKENMKILNQLLIIETKERNNSQIISWWELRRFLYNIIVLVCGLISLSIMYAIVDLKPGEDLIEPLAIIGFAIVSNICYTFGWLTEILSEKSITYGATMFKVGLGFTIIMVFIPAVFQIIYWIEGGIN